MGVEGEKKVRLHYGGETFTLPANHAKALRDYEGEPGTITLNLGDGKQLTFAVGPGIPVLIEEWAQRPARVARVL